MSDFFARTTATDKLFAPVQVVVDVELLNDVAEAVLDENAENLTIAAERANIAVDPRKDLHSCYRFQ